MSLSGEVDVATWGILSDALESLLERGSGPHSEIVLDLTEISFIDGHGVGLIVQAAQSFNHGKRIVVRGAPSGLLRIARILGLDAGSGVVIEGLDSDERP